MFPGLARQLVHVDAEGIEAKHLKNVTNFLSLILATSKVVPRYVVQTLDSRPYLERIVLHREGEHGAGTYLHLIWESDLDRDPHDHPFDFQSRIIYGGYAEERFIRWCKPCDRYTKVDTTICMTCGGVLSCKSEGVGNFRAGFQNVVRAHQLHRLSLISKPTVTLVTRGPKVREWGFQTQEGWMPSREWIKLHKPDATTEIE